ncbi:serine/arginine-rich SC35-like splicing factor SCL30A isoform X3 [Musa acuminata AAA Group]|uniref:serine/arginine-rich SC35-like splicing factor SCL30A isoform X3 n=1 Tax=Musa acuminata AAA Group TaxID=214697 RepID=UPI0031D09425
MRGRSYSPSPPRGYGRRRRSPSPRGRYSSRGRDLPTSLLVRNLRRDCREPRGFGFIQYVDPADAAEAKYQMDGQILLGRELTVVFAEENRKKPSDMRARERRDRVYDSRRSPHNSRDPVHDYRRSPRRSRGPVHDSRRSPRQARSPYYSHSRSRSRSRSYESPSSKRQHYSRSASPQDKTKHRERSYSQSPAGSRSRSRSPEGLPSKPSRRERSLSVSG